MKLQLLCEDRMPDVFDVVATERSDCCYRIICRPHHVYPPQKLTPTLDDYEDEFEDDSFLKVDPAVENHGITGWFIGGIDDDDAYESCYKWERLTKNEVRRLITTRFGEKGWQFFFRIWNRGNWNNQHWQNQRLDDFVNKF